MSLATSKTVKEIEEIIAYNEEHPIRTKIIVPNISWGFFNGHEADLVVINKSLYLTEYEIKRSFEDFKNDFKKKDYHDDNRISSLWYVVPDAIANQCSQYLQSQHKIGEQHAGIYSFTEDNYYELKLIVKCNYSKGKPLYIEDALNIARLGTLRYWKNRLNIENQ